MSAEGVQFLVSNSLAGSRRACFTVRLCLSAAGCLLYRPVNYRSCRIGNKIASCGRGFRMSSCRAASRSGEQFPSCGVCARVCVCVCFIKKIHSTDPLPFVSAFSSWCGNAIKAPFRGKRSRFADSKHDLFDVKEKHISPVF